MDPNPANVFPLTTDWALRTPRREPWLTRDYHPAPKAKVRTIEGDDAIPRLRRAPEDRRSARAVDPDPLALQ